MLVWNNNKKKKMNRKRENQLKKMEQRRKRYESTNPEIAKQIEGKIVALKGKKQ